MFLAGYETTGHTIAYAMYGFALTSAVRHAMKPCRQTCAHQ